MMRVEIIPVLGDNYAYLVCCEQSGVAAVVDPADADPVDRRVRELGLDLVAIWNTHHHWDHTAGNEALCQRWAQLEVVGHESDRGRLPCLSKGVEHGALVELGALSARILHTPGHTRGGIAYLLEGAVFTGDTLFGAGCGRLFEGTPETMHHSLMGVLGELDDATQVYCGHEYTQKNLAFASTLEPSNQELQQRVARVDALRAEGKPGVPSTMGEERQTNPFLRGQSVELRQSLRERGEQDVDDEVKAYAAARRLRDRF